MEREQLKHPRVFDDPDWAEGYYRREGKRSARMGIRYAAEFRKQGFGGGRILDVGCGPGTAAIELARAFPDSEVIGIDLSEILIEKARALTEEARLGDRVRFEIADVEAIPFEDDSFDAMVNLNMFHIVEDPVAMCNEMERVLKADGYLLLGCIRRSWIGLLIPIFRTAFTLEEAKEIVARSNLRPVDYAEGFLWWGFSALRSDNEEEM